MNLSKVAFVTYNSIGRNLASGWHHRNDRSAFVLQNSKGKSVATIYEGESGVVRNEIDTLWQTLEQVLPELDHLVIYVGASGSERAIELASRSGLSDDQITFVLCDCDLSYKDRLISRSSKPNAGRVYCECRGIETMRELFESFLNAGTLQ